MPQEATSDSYRISPGAFSDPSASDYLGNPDVVTYLVGGFCANVEAVAGALDAQSIEPAEVKVEVGAEITRLAGIFSGRDPVYKTIKGYNEHGLPAKLMVDLAPHWRQHRAAWNDDPVCVLFDWLAALVMEKSKIADGDDMLLEVMLKPSVQYAVTVLLGTDRRA